MPVPTSCGETTPQDSQRRGQPHGRLEEQCVDERLRQVSSELALLDVELLGQEARRPAGGAIALEPAHRFDQVALLELREAYDEAAEEKRSLGFAQRSRVVTKPVREMIF